MNRYLQRYSVRHAISVSLAVLTAIILNHYVSLSKEGWVVVTTFLVSQTTRGTPLRQGLFYFFMMAMVALLFPAETMQTVQYRVVDTTMGGLIGLTFSLFVLPTKIYTEFALGVLPLLRGLIDYSQVLAQLFRRDIDHGALLIKHKWQIETALTAKQGLYPEWVYEVGFNPGLRAGYRFFLLNLERITEVFFSLHYFVSSDFDPLLLSDFSHEILQVIQKNDELLQAMIHYFEGRPIAVAVTEGDFTSDLTALEIALQHVVPADLDLLDMSADYITLVGIVRDLKDLRGLLLTLIIALPVPPLRNV